MSSSGEIKMSLREMTFFLLIPCPGSSRWATHILMAKMFEQLQFSICAFGQYWC